MANKVTVLLNFINRIGPDERMCTSHITLYTFLWRKWKDLPDKNAPLMVFFHEMRGFCKISSSSTYHRTIRQLYDFGYIRYTPSFNHTQGSLIEFDGWDEPEKTIDPVQSE